MTNTMLQQFWDVYVANPDCDEEYRGKMLFADPDQEVPESVLRNFTAKEKNKLFLMDERSLATSQAVAANGFVLSTIE